MAVEVGKRSGRWDLPEEDSREMNGDGGFWSEARVGCFSLL